MSVVKRTWIREKTKKRNRISWFANRNTVLLQALELAFIYRIRSNLFHYSAVVVKVNCFSLSLNGPEFNPFSLSAKTDPSAGGTPVSRPCVKFYGHYLSPTLYSWLDTTRPPARHDSNKAVNFTAQSTQELQSTCVFRSSGMESPVDGSKRSRSRNSNITVFTFDIFIPVLHYICNIFKEYIHLK